MQIGKIWQKNFNFFLQGAFLLPFYPFYDAKRLFLAVKTNERLIKLLYNPFCKIPI